MQSYENDESVRNKGIEKGRGGRGKRKERACCLCDHVEQQPRLICVGLEEGQRGHVVGQPVHHLHQKLLAMQGHEHRKRLVPPGHSCRTSATSGEQPDQI